MATIGTVRVENFTGHQREGMVTCILPLADSVLLPTQLGSITAVDAEFSPGNQRCQAMQIGPLYDSGYLMYVLLTFKAEIAAGTSKAAYPSYATYEFKDVTITDDTTAGVTYAVHSAALAGLANTTIKLRIPYPTTPTSRVLDQYHEVQFPIADILNFGEYEQEVGFTSVQRVKRFKMFRRYVPPAGSNLPSIGGELLMEIPHDMRQIKFYFTLCNSYITFPGQTAQYDGTKFDFPDNTQVQLIIDGPTVAVDHGDIYLQSPPNVAGSVTTINLLEVDYSEESTYLVWTGQMFELRTHFANNGSICDGMEIPVYGSLLYDSGAASLEADTMNAEAESWMEANSYNHGDHNTWLANRVMHRQPRNSIIETPAEALTAASKQAYDDYQNLEGIRQPFFNYRKLMTQPTIEDPTSDQGYYKAFHLARTGLADFRALRACAIKEWASRAQWFRYPQGELFKNRNHWRIQAVGTPDPIEQGGTGESANQWTDVYCWGIRPFFGSIPWTQRGSPLPQGPADGLGKRTNWPAFGQGSPRGWDVENARHEDFYTPSNGQHHTANYFHAYVAMTGCMWARRHSDAMLELLLATLPPFHWGTKHIGSSAVWNKHTPRMEGNQLWSLCSAYWTATDPLTIARVKQHLIDRLELSYPVTTTGMFQKGLTEVFDIINEPPMTGTAASGKFVPRTTLKRVYFGPTRSNFLGFPSQFVESAICWHEAHAFQGMWGCYQVTGDVRFKYAAMWLAYSTSCWYARLRASEGASINTAFPESTNRRNSQGERDTPFTDEEKYDGATVTSVRTGEEVHLGEPLSFDWSGGTGTAVVRATIAMAWEFAQEQGDTLWAQRVKLLLESPGRLGIPAEESVAGPYGWGDRDSNYYEYVGIIDDLWKSRSLNEILQTANLRADAQFSVNAEQVNPYYDLANFQCAALFIGADEVVGSGGTPGPVHDFAQFQCAAVFTGQDQVTEETEDYAHFRCAALFTGADEVVDPVVSPDPPTLYLEGDIRNTVYINVEVVGGTVTKVDQTFSMWSGNDYLLVFRIYDQDGKLEDLRGVTEFIWALYNRVGSSAVLTYRLTTGGVYIPDQTYPERAEQNNPFGEVRITVSREDTKTLNDKFYHESLIMFDTGAYTPFIGHALIQPANLSLS